MAFPMTAQPNFAHAFAHAADSEQLPVEPAADLPPPADECPAPRRRLAGRLAHMRASIAGKVRVFAISFTLILTLLGLLLGGTLAVLSTRAGDASVSASRALAASQLATSIAESRYFASRYAAEGEARMIASAFATLDQARSEIDATIALDGGGSQSREQMEWLVTQVEGFAPELRALQASINAHGPSPTGDALAGAIDISGSQLAQQAEEIETALRLQADAAQQALDTLGTWAIVLALTMIAGCIVLVIAGARGLSRQVSGSLSEITGAMTRLARGDRSIEIPPRTARTRSAKWRARWWCSAKAPMRWPNCSARRAPSRMRCCGGWSTTSRAAWAKRWAAWRRPRASCRQPRPTWQAPRRALSVSSNRFRATWPKRRSG